MTDTQLNRARDLAALAVSGSGHLQPDVAVELMRERQPIIGIAIGGAATCLDDETREHLVATVEAEHQEWMAR